jgi:HEAT repeat protein
LHDDRVLPAMRRAFESRENKSERQHLALSLIRLGEKDEKYLDLLMAYAQTAIDSDAPEVLTHDEKGDAVRGVINPDFVAWAERGGLSVDKAAGQSLYEYPEDVMLLGNARDPRAASLLKRGLQSRNDVVVSMAAQGLALLNDVSALPLILQAGQARGKSMRFSLASMLAIYDSAEALRWIDQFLMDPELRKTYQQGREIRLKNRENRSVPFRPKDR